MGQIFDLTNTDIKKIVDEILQNNIELKEWEEKSGKIKEEIESIFYTRNNAILDTNYQYNVQNYMQNMQTGRRACLYPPNSDIHICVRDIVLNFLKIIFSPSVWGMMKTIYCRANGVADDKVNSTDIVVVINQIKQIIIKSVIQLRKEEFCFYLQIITHFAEHREMDIHEILDWIPKAGTECSWSEVSLECAFRENGNCILKNQVDSEAVARKILNEMEKKGILKKHRGREDTYKINY